VMPTITSANTNAASLMIGERGARLILEDAPSPRARGEGAERKRGR
jgi:choline dehydrogenase